MPLVDDPLTLAIHESAHVAVAALLGWQVEAATIENATPGGFRGLVTYRPGGEAPCADVALMCLAGPMAAAYAYWKPISPTGLASRLGDFLEHDPSPRGGVRADGSEAWASLRLAHPGESGEALERRFNAVSTRAADLVSHPAVWRGIEALAEALLARKTLDGAEATAIFHRAARLAPTPTYR